METVDQITPPSTLGELITCFYKEFLELYGDEDRASVAAAAAINDLLSQEVEPAN